MRKLRTSLFLSAFLSASAIAAMLAYAAPPVAGAQHLSNDTGFDVTISGKTYSNLVPESARTALSVSMRRVRHEDHIVRTIELEPNLSEVTVSVRPTHPQAQVTAISPADADAIAPERRVRLEGPVWASGDVAVTVTAQDGTARTVHILVLSMQCHDGLGHGRVAIDGDACVILDSILVSVDDDHTVDYAAEQLEALPGWSVRSKLHNLRMVTAEHIPDNLTLSQLYTQLRQIRELDWALDAEADALAGSAGGIDDIPSDTSASSTSPAQQGSSQQGGSPGSGGTSQQQDASSGSGGGSQPGTSQQQDGSPGSDGDSQTAVEFSDVASGAWFHGYVQPVAQLGIATGYPDGTYRPNEPVTRAQMAAFVSRALGGPAADSSEPSAFSDVAPDAWYHGAVQHIAGLGITVGYPDGTYRPEESVTRAQMALFIYRAFDVADPSPGADSFADVAPGQARTAIEALYAVGITAGYPDGTYRPDEPVTRAHMAAFLSRAVTHTTAPAG